MYWLPNYTKKQVNKTFDVTEGPCLYNTEMSVLTAVTVKYCIPLQVELYC